MVSGRLKQKMNNGFGLQRKSLEAIDYGRKIPKKIFPLNYSLEIESFNKGLQINNVEAKSQVYLE